jgi:hypothetical protein
MKRSMLAAAVALFGVLALGTARPGTSHADVDGSDHFSFPISVTCVSSGQLCSPAASQVVPTGGTYQVQFTAAVTGCSAYRVFISIDGVLVHTSAFLNPGDSTSFLVNVFSLGSHQIDVQAEGTVGGCNAGALGSWAGTLTVDIFAPLSPQFLNESQLFFLQRQLMGGAGGAVGAVAAAASKSAAANRARANQAAQAPAPPPSITAPSTGTGIISLPSTGQAPGGRGVDRGLLAVGALLVIGGLAGIGLGRRRQPASVPAPNRD